LQRKDHSLTVRVTQAEGFAKQFELPQSYQKIADAQREEMRTAKEAADAAAEALKHPAKKQP
jgi:hypothetical protein